MAIADITVLGAGIFGLSIAWTAHQRGARVKVIEAQSVGAGSSGGLVGALAPHTPENWNSKKQFQFESLILAERFWQSVSKASGLDPGYARSGRIQIIQDERGLELANARAESAVSLWQGAAAWRVVSQAEFTDWAPLSATGLLIYDTLSALLHPRLAIRSLAHALRSVGAEIIEGNAEPEGIVIEATGEAGLRELSDAFGKQVGNGVKGQAAAFQFDAAGKPQLFLDGLHIIPHRNGTTAIGSTSERNYDDDQNTDHQLEDLIEKARRLCPALAESPVINRWAGIRPRAKSRAPMLGHHPLREERLIANGGFKIGFGMAPKVAEVMVDLALEGRDTIPAEFKVAASL